MTKVELGLYIYEDCLAVTPTAKTHSQQWQESNTWPSSHSRQLPDTKVVSHSNYLLISVIFLLALLQGHVTLDQGLWLTKCSDMPDVTFSNTHTRSCFKQWLTQPLHMQSCAHLIIKKSQCDKNDILNLPAFLAQ